MRKVALTKPEAFLQAETIQEAAGAEGVQYNTELTCLYYLYASGEFCSSLLSDERGDQLSLKPTQVCADILSPVGFQILLFFPPRILSEIFFWTWRNTLGSE